jgi:LysM repeat protein
MIGPDMASRRPARWLAPLALLASVVAVLAVISANRSASRDGSSAPQQSAPAGRSATTGTTTTTSQRGGSKRAPSTYRVQSGDTLLRVAEKTGVPIERIRALNPTADANALRVGQILRLRPRGQ